MKAIVALLFVAVTCSAWKLKPDDTPKLKEELERTAATDLEAFVTGDESQRSTLYRVPLDILKAVEKNNKKVLGALEPIENLMQKLSRAQRFAPLADLALKAITSFLDGNRDNFSYYKLDACREWAQRRKDAGVTGPDAGTLDNLIRESTVARDSLDTMAQAFVKGVKDIKEETKDLRHVDHEAVRQAADHTVEVGQANKQALMSTPLMPSLSWNSGSSSKLLHKTLTANYC